MSRLTLLLIPLILLSSCTIDWNDEKDKKIIQPIQIQKIETGAITTKNPKPQTATGAIIKDFGTGFILSQNDDKTRLTYSGKTIKTWSHTPTEKIPFIWDDTCIDLFELMDMVNPEERQKNPNWKQKTWDALGQENKKNCIKEYLRENIRTEKLDERFYEIIQTQYETATQWIYDTKSGNLQEMPTMGTLKLTESESGTTVFIDMSYGDNNMTLLYNKTFSELISKEEIPK